MPDGMADRRVAPRYPLILAAEVTEIESGTKLSARTADVSRTGCYVDTLNPTPSGVAILVRLTHETETFESRGRVIYVSQGLGMGVAFVDVAADQLAVLDKWLAAAAG